MSSPYLYPQYCPVCDSRMDPNADNRHTNDGESVCSKECQDERNLDQTLADIGKAPSFPAQVNDMLRGITIGPKP